MVTDLFAGQVRARPPAVGVSCDDVSLTYRELDARSGALARLRRARYAVGRDRLVALVLDRRVADIVGVPTDHIGVCDALFRLGLNSSLVVEPIARLEWSQSPDGTSN